MQYLFQRIILPVRLCSAGLYPLILNCSQGRGAGIDSPSTPRRGKGGGRGRKKANHSFDPIPGETDKPFGCERKYNLSSIIFTFCKKRKVFKNIV